jgi:ankyrin repeat protein
MPVRSLPDNPSLEHLRKQAKQLLRAVRSGDAQALEQVREFHAESADFSLADAQRVVARGHGFGGWAPLKSHLAVIDRYRWEPAPSPASSPADAFLRLVVLDYADWRPSHLARAESLVAAVAGTNLYTAAAAGDADTARRVLDAEPSLVATRGGPYGWEPLLYACYSRLGRSTLEVTRLLLSRGADPDAGFLWRGLLPPFTALTGVFGEGEAGVDQPPHPEAMAMARLLLEAGADPNDGQTIYNRGFKRDDEHLRLLLSFGLGRDRRGPWFARLGDRLPTPRQMLADELWRAAKGGLADRVALLVENGADVNAATTRTRRHRGDGRVPHEAALLAGHPEIAAYLADHGARPAALDPLQTFAAACLAGDESARGSAELLHRLGARGRAELVHKAVESRRPEALRLMASLGFDLSAMTRNTPLHNAAWSGDLELVRLLVELGADPGAREPTYHATPLGWARYNRQQEVVDYLVQFADVFDALDCQALERLATLLRSDPELTRAVDHQGKALADHLHPEMERFAEAAALLRAHGVALD